MNLIEDIVFEKEDYTQLPLRKGEYEYCKFLNCNFSNTNLSGYKFLECEFNNCNLSMVKLGETLLRDIQFFDCKMLGVNFEHCSAFGFSAVFTGVTLNHSSFYKRKMQQFIFSNCQLTEVDFTDADCSGATFYNCDFTNAKFENTNLEKCDFTSSYNFFINPQINNIRKAKFSQAGLAGLLHQYQIEIIP